MTQQRTVTELEHCLREAEPDRLTAVRLASIRARGRRRRRARVSAYAGGAAALVLGGALWAGIGGSDVARDSAPVASPAPKELSPLAARALAEVPGAAQVTAWQVVIPEPTGAEDLPEQVVPPEYVEGGPVDIGARRYSDVANFSPDSLPAWLTGERHRDQGVYVDAGDLELACMRPLPEWDSPSDACSPVMLGVDGDRLTYAWGMGTDDFLTDGSDLELFSSGAVDTVWVGGRDGTDATEVDLVTTDGSVTEATVAVGTLVPEETMFWGPVDGELAQVVVYDADGEVLERHQVKPCSDPVDCEVR